MQSSALIDEGYLSELLQVCFNVVLMSSHSEGGIFRRFP